MIANRKNPIFAVRYLARSSRLKQVAISNIEISNRYRDELTSLGELVLTEVHIAQIDQTLQATGDVVQCALRVPAHQEERYAINQ